MEQSKNVLSHDAAAFLFSIGFLFLPKICYEQVDILYPLHESVVKKLKKVGDIRYAVAESPDASSDVNCLSAQGKPLPEPGNTGEGIPAHSIGREIGD